MSCGLPSTMCPTAVVPAHPHDGLSITPSNGHHDAPSSVLALRDALEGAVITYKIYQARHTLNPQDTTGDDATITLQPDNSSELGILTELALDTTPGILGIASVGSAFNLAAFGVAGVAHSLKLTRGWIRRNIIPANATIMVDRNAAPRLVITNFMHYTVALDVTYTLGILDRGRAMAIIRDLTGRVLG